MQFTANFFLLAVALAYGGTTTSALPVGESSLAARSAEYEDFNARGVHTPAPDPESKQEATLTKEAGGLSEEAGGLKMQAGGLKMEAEGLKQKEQGSKHKSAPGVKKQGGRHQANKGGATKSTRAKT
ncbi:hypothetical protein BYT27DRAFT_7196575 [Phlegmacium glaucopus]|nr:hypothetical protein BYT27DRAFT_7196575 [Phlegmacium glaucopus]